MDVDDLIALAEGLDPEDFRRLVRRRLRDLPAMSDGPRDVRRGDRWLPWHFRGDPGEDGDGRGQSVGDEGGAGADPGVR